MFPLRPRFPRHNPISELFPLSSHAFVRDKDGASVRWRQERFFVCPLFRWPSTCQGVCFY
ncbi:hypothetical protein RB213_007465 [Colletotrichum asianum]